MAKFELYVTHGCPYSGEAREWLEWQGHEFVEYDVEQDPAARTRMMELSAGQRMVPVIVKDGKVISIGWHGRGCAVA